MLSNSDSAAVFWSCSKGQAKPWTRLEDPAQSMQSAVEPGEDGEDGEGAAASETFLDDEDAAEAGPEHILEEAKPSPPRRQRSPGRPLPRPKKARAAKESPDTPLVTADMVASTGASANDDHPPSPPSPGSVFVNPEFLSGMCSGRGLTGRETESKRT